VRDDGEELFAGLARGALGDDEELALLADEGELGAVLLELGVAHGGVFERRDEQAEDARGRRVDAEGLALDVDGALVGGERVVGDGGADPRDEAGVVVRFGDEVVGAGREGADDVLRIGERREQEDREVARGLGGLEAATHFEAVDAGHEHVAHDDVGHRGALAEAEPRLAVLGHERDEAGLFEQAPEAVRLRLAVFDDEDLHEIPLLAQSHAAMSPSARTSSTPPRSSAAFGIP
jgi:hypothetical protein